MLKAKFKRAGIFRIILTITLLPFLLFLTGFLTVSIFKDNSKIDTRNMPVAVIILYLILFYVVIIFVVKSFLDRAFNITIDTQGKMICFRSLITFQTKRYSFDDFDSYFDILSAGKSGVFREVYLLRSGKVEKVICGMYFANIDELMEGLYPIKYDGFKKSSLKLSLQTLFNREINID